MSRLLRTFLYLIVVFVILPVLIICFYKHFSKPSIEQFDVVDRFPRIYPDYSGTVIPPNIAPLNFLLKEEGKYYHVKIYSEKGDTIEIGSSNGKIKIPRRKWRQLLSQNKNKDLFFDAFVKAADGKWKKFNTVKTKIAAEDIDNYLCYRKIHPGHALWSNIGIYQRDLSNFNETPILTNDYFQKGCQNCHTFWNNNPEKAVFVIRSEIFGADTIMVKDTNVEKIGTKFTYSAWHPSGKLIAFSLNKVRQFYHSSRKEIRDVIDLDSLMAYYIVDSNTVKTSSKFSRKDYLETYPAWSPDGRFLYFCAAPIAWQTQDKIPPDNYKVKYDLLRISYDVENDQWGELDTVISSQSTGLSIVMPRISYDGKWLLSCMADYGCFNVYSRSSDLYIIDLEDANQSGEFIPKRLEINSDESESWHSWSSNSRWIVFSSKRDFGVFTKLYISYIDENGNAYKPIILPQKDPIFYDSCLQAYNTPELIVGPVLVRGERLASVVRGRSKIMVDMPVTMATPKAEAEGGDVWRGQRE